MEEKKERAVLHSDANAFYASVECVLDPSLKGKPVAVCGATEARHGIVLAKSEEAKRAGIKTGMTNGEARRLCPGLIAVPPHHEIYAQFSARLREIYDRYTDRVEPYGLDECWLDVTNGQKTPRAIAEEIRASVKEELGITVSVGISFNKVFAKLGSDMKKPDAVTEIPRERFREMLCGLSCSALLYCGKATAERLARMGIRTIGELAAFPPALIARTLGKNGQTLQAYARGEDDSPVARSGERAQAKSIGHGVTCVADLTDPTETELVFVALADEIGGRLRALSLRAAGIQVSVRDEALCTESWQKRLALPTQCALTLAREGQALLLERYRWRRNIRSLTLSAIRLERENEAEQLSLFGANDKRRKAEEAVDGIRRRFGADAVRPALLLCKNKLPPGIIPHAVLPRKGPQN